MAGYVRRSVVGLGLVLILLHLVAQFKCEYFKSNEIAIDESLQVGAEMISLNKLLAGNYKYQGQDGSFVFRLINDTKLCEFVELKRLPTPASTSLVLKKALDFDLICQTDRLPNKSPDGLASCTQSLKVIRLNENDFIEIPVLISKATKPLSIALSFAKSSVVFNLTKLKNVFLIDGASVMNAENGAKPEMTEFEIGQLSSRVNYKLLKLKGLALVSSKNAFKNASKFLNYNDFIKWSVQKLSPSNQLKLSIGFLNEQTFEKAIQLDLEFSFQLIAFIRSENNQNYYVMSSSSQNRTIGSIKGSKMNLFFRIDKNDYELEKEKLSIKPLYFERPIYSLVIDDKTDLNATILQPKLSSHQYPQLDDIVFKILPSPSGSKNHSSSEEEEDKLENLPFQIDERTGAIKLKDGKDLESILSRDDYEMTKLFTFDIKATYRKIDSTTSRPDDASSKASDSLYSYYNYMIPALAKVEISLNFNENDQTIPNIDFTILALWLANFKVVVTETNKSNQTVIFFINQPIVQNTTLLNVFLNSNSDGHESRKSSSIDFKRFYWSFSGVDSNSFRYHFTSKPTHHFRLNSNTNLELNANDQSNFDFVSNFDLRDQTTYRTSVKLIQKRAQNKLLRNQNSSLKYSQINFEFRVGLPGLGFRKANLLCRTQSLQLGQPASRSGIGQPDN